MPRRISERPMSVQDVVVAGLSLLDEVGEDKFTMRALADRLSTYPNTIYWHAGNRDQVLALVVEHALTEIALPAADPVDWRTWLGDLAHEYRRVLSAHPAIAGVAATQLLVSPRSLDLVEPVLEVLARAGFTGRLLVGAYNAFVGSLIGWVSLELASARSLGGPRDSDWREAFATTLAELDPGTYPTLVAHRDVLADQAFTLRWHGGIERPMDASFEMVVQVWLDGLAATLPVG